MRPNTCEWERPFHGFQQPAYLDRRIAFGNSYTYVQGTGSRYPSFIGSYLPDEFGFSAEELLSSKIVQNFTGTANAGPNWAEFLTGCGVEEGETCPRSCEIQLWDFAFAGADVSSEFLPAHHDYTIPLVNQTQRYLKWAEPVIGRDMDKSKALVAVWIGINDVIDSAGFTNVSLPEFYDELISAVVEESVQPLYDAGYKNFLFMNMPPLDRAPEGLVRGSLGVNKTMIDWWDEALDEQRRSFAAANPSAKAMVYDANRFLNRVMDEPDSYGIENTESFCRSYDNPKVTEHPETYGCRPLDEYFWHDAAHM